MQDRGYMIEVWFVSGDNAYFELREGETSWEWIPEQLAYLIPSVDGDVVVPSAFVKLLKHFDIDLEDNNEVI